MAIGFICQPLFVRTIMLGETGGRWKRTGIGAVAFRFTLGETDGEDVVILFGLWIGSNFARDMGSTCSDIRWRPIDRTGAGRTFDPARAPISPGRIGEVGRNEVIQRSREDVVESGFRGSVGLVPYVAAYVAIAAVFTALDAVWLTYAGRLIYRPTLGDILLTDIRYAPAIAFYMTFPLGVLIFGTLAGARSGGLSTALVYGGLFGAFAYATYDLTNFATLRNWTLQITLLDIVYGAIISAIAAAAGLAAFRAAGA